MPKLKIALGDLSYLNGRNTFNLYVPLNIGYLAAYAKHHFGADVDVRLFKDPKALIDYSRAERPNLIGLTYYYWNERLNALAIRKLRGELGNDPLIVLGGPSIDTNAAEQQRELDRFPGVDAIVPNEGEDAFGSILRWMLGGRVGGLPTDGIISRGHTSGLSVGLKTDLSLVPSPYLDGTLDPFLNDHFQPMIQTSRLCPYTCAFCTSGKNRGKLRAFNLDQVAAELDYIGRKFHDRPNHRMYITDDNFGVMERDIEVAKKIIETRDKHGYPKQLFYYNDKRFTQTSRTLQEICGSMVYHGVILSMQSDNPETLKAINRRNVTDEHVVSAIGWAHGLGLDTSTELIFGLPMETLDSFLAVIDKCARLGFDKINCYNLIIFGGIEMNRAAYRAQHGIKTERRLLDGCDMVLEGELVVEHEEVVTSSNSFSFEDYKLIRKVNVVLHAIFIEGMHREFFKSLVAEGKSLAGFIQEFLRPVPGYDEESQQHYDFLMSLDEAIASELYTDEQIESMIAQVQAGHGELPKEIKLQRIYASRLLEAKDDWVLTVLGRTRDEYKPVLAENARGTSVGQLAV